jgi:hypothetical protein
MEANSQMAPNSARCPGTPEGPYSGWRGWFCLNLSGLTWPELHITQPRPRLLTRSKGVK